MEKPKKYEGNIADFHVDLANPRLAEILNNPELNYAERRTGQLTPEGLSKVDLIFASVYRRINKEQKALAIEGKPEDQQAGLRDHQKIIDYYEDTKNFRVIKKPEDLNIDRNGKTNLILHLECGDIITGPEVVDELYSRGVRSIGPLYSHDNQIGGGAGGDVSRGLTSLGRRIVDKIVEKGMIIDTSHANRKTTDEIIERVRNYAKIATTHTAFGEKERFITPDILKRIAVRGGVVGFTPAIPFFPTLEKYIENMKKASDLTGSVENLAIGTDFGGLDAEHLYKELDEIGKLSIVAEKLSEQGRFSDEDIARIMYGNIARIVKQLK